LKYASKSWWILAILFLTLPTVEIETGANALAIPQTERDGSWSSIPKAVDLFG